MQHESLPPEQADPVSARFWIVLNAQIRADVSQQVSAALAVGRNLTDLALTYAFDNLWSASDTAPSEPPLA